jgi:cysteinyl-tRNA synthetase
MTLRVFDTLAAEKRDFEPLQEGKVSMYVCGITPYDLSHLGHARCYVTYDLIFRYLKSSGYEVTYVRNFTDVDDKIIKRANERGVEATTVAEENIQAFYEDMDALGLLRPTTEPRVTTTIPEIIDLVKQLIDNGKAYETGGDVYYRVEAFDGYGKLSRRSLEDMQAGARVEVNDKKHNPMDFALWKAAKPGEPKWDSPWGEGRPGWHIECSAMSMAHLGETFDIHGGGRDLIFPHHENEIAQSEGAHPGFNVRFWVHNGFVNVDNEKMSKSLDNFFTIREIIKRYTPETLRFFLIGGAHYRGPINFSDKMLDEAACRLVYFYETLLKAEAFLAEDHGEHSGPLPQVDVIEQLPLRFSEAMDDDFNAAKAMDPLSEAFRVLNELVSTKKQKQKAAAAASAQALLAAIRKVDEVLGLFAAEAGPYLARHMALAAARMEIDTRWIDDQLAARVQARQDKNWEEADRIRDALNDKGVVIMDGVGDATTWKIDETATGC